MNNNHIGLLTSDHIHFIKAGSRFDFVPPLPLMESPLDLSNAPYLDEVDAAFWYQGTLYLLRSN